MAVASVSRETLVGDERRAATSEGGAVAGVCALATPERNDVSPCEATSGWRRLGTKGRLCGSAAAGVSVVVVALSRALSSVDLQSLPVVCPMRLLFGIPCPTCGMTTSFAHLGGLRIREAFLANPAGPLVFLAFVLAGATGLVAAIWNRVPSVSLELRPSIRRFALACVVPIVGMMWTAELLRFGVI